VGFFIPQPWGSGPATLHGTANNSVWGFMAVISCGKLNAVLFYRNELPHVQGNHGY